MHLEMKKVLGKDEVAITIYAEPVQILSIEGNYVTCEWENRRWKMYLPSWYASIFSEEFDDAMTHAFLSRLNGLLKTVGEVEEPK